MSWKHKLIDGFGWSFVDNFGTKLLQFAFGILLARLLTPHEYGLLGIVVVLVAFAQVFVDSGFSQAMVRKPECSPADFNGVFWFNMGMGAFFYLLFFILAGPIAVFFREPQLVDLVRVTSLVLIVNSTSIIQRIMVTRTVDFKVLAQISLVASLVSNGVAVALACQGMGVWSLAVRVLLETAISSALLWRASSFRLHLSFDCKAFKEMFAYSYKLLISGVLDCIYKQINQLIVGKVFTVVQLGYYTRASQFTELPATSASSVVARVTFPVFARLEGEELLGMYRKVQGGVAWAIFSLMAVLGAMAPSMVSVLLGEKWMPSVPYMQLMCLAMMFYPLHSLNLQVLAAKGYSDLYLRLEVIKKILVVPVVFAGIEFGILVLLWGLVLASLFSSLINGFYAGRILGYPLIAQLRDIAPILGVSLVGSVAVWGIGFLFAMITPAFLLFLQIVLGILVVIGLSALGRISPFCDARNLLASKMEVSLWKRQSM